MKKNTIVLFVAITILIGFSSCKIESGDDLNGNVTEKGFELCHYWDNNLNAEVISTIEKAFNLNAYIVAPEGSKTLIEDLYFPYYKIRQIDSTQWTLIEQQATRYSFKTNGKALSEIGAQWIITSYRNSDAPQLEVLNSYAIECTGVSTWHITTTNSDPFYVNYTLTTDTMVETLTSEPYTLEGSSFQYYSTYYAYASYDSNYENNADIFIDATITEPIHKTAQGYSSGKINLKATNDANQEMETTAEFYRQNPVVYKVKITYKGVTESWVY